MTYRVSLNSIVENLERYCKHVDSLCACYKAEQKKLEKDLQKMQGTYTDGYIQQTKKNWKPDIDYAAEMQKKREQTKTIVQFHLKSIKKKMDCFYGGILNMEIANKLTTAKAMGIKLTMKEIEGLREQAKSYFDRRVIDTYAIECGYVNTSPLPDMDSAARAFCMLEGAAKGCLDRYCGKDAYLYDYVGDTSLLAQNDRTIAKAICTGADSIIRKDNATINNIVCIMNKLEEISNSKEKEALTESDIAFINAILPESDFKKYPELARKQAVEIARANADVAVLLALDSRYSDAVTKALQE